MQFPSFKKLSRFFNTAGFKILIICVVVLVAGALGLLFGPPLMSQLERLSQTAETEQAKGTQKEKSSQEKERASGKDSASQTGSDSQTGQESQQEQDTETSEIAHNDALSEADEIMNEFYEEWEDLEERLNPVSPSASLDAFVLLSILR